MTVISLYGWGGVTRMIAVWLDIGEIDHQSFRRFDSFAYFIRPHPQCVIFFIGSFKRIGFGFDEQFLLVLSTAKYSSFVWAFSVSALYRCISVLLRIVPNTSMLINTSVSALAGETTSMPRRKNTVCTKWERKAVSRGLVVKVSFR